MSTDLLTSIFHAADRNGTGSLTRAEMLAHLQDSEQCAAFRIVFQTMDVDRDKQISLEEFVAYFDGERVAKKLRLGGADRTQIQRASILVIHTCAADNALAEACGDLGLDLIAAHETGQDASDIEAALLGLHRTRVHTRGQLTAAMIRLCTSLSITCGTTAQETVEEMLRQQTGDRRAAPATIDALRIVAATFASPAGVHVMANLE